MTSEVHDYIRSLHAKARATEGPKGPRRYGFWTGRRSQSDTRLCEVLLSADFTLMDVDCSISNDFGAMCLHFEQNKLQEIQQDIDKQGASSNYMYTCQCPYGFGFENCTKASDEQRAINPEITFCKDKERDITLKPDADNKVIAIDHIAYGRPFRQQGSFPFTGVCQAEDFAQNEEEYCVSPNALAAVTYWCQGKSECRFNLDDLDQMMESKEFEVPESNAESFFQALQECEHRDSALAYPATLPELTDFLRTISDLKDVDMDMFWVDNRTATTEATKKYVVLEESGPADSDCIALDVAKSVRN